MHSETPSTALNEVEVARRLGVSTAVLRLWRFRGTGPRFCRFGRSVRYLADDVERFIEASAVAPPDPPRKREQSGGPQ